MSTSVLAAARPGSDDRAAVAPCEPPKSMVERVTAIVDAFDDPRATLPLEQISIRTGLPRSTTHRILDQLIDHDWMAHTGDGYRLGARVLNTSTPHDNELRLRRAAAPVLERLQVQTGLVVHLSVLDGRHVVYLDKLGGSLAVGVPSQVGMRRAANATAGGKAMLSQLDDEEVTSLLPSPLPRLTRQTIPTLPVLLLELRRIRHRHGLAFEIGEAADGVSCIAAPIRVGGGQGAAVSLCSQSTANDLHRFAPLLVQGMRRIETDLMWPEDEATSTRDVGSRPTDSDHTWSPETSQRLLSIAQQRAWL